MFLNLSVINSILKVYSKKLEKYYWNVINETYTQKKKKKKKKKKKLKKKKKSLHISLIIFILLFQLFVILQ